MTLGLVYSRFNPYLREPLVVTQMLFQLRGSTLYSEPNTIGSESLPPHADGDAVLANGSDLDDHVALIQPSSVSDTRRVHTGPAAVLLPSVMV